MRLGQPQTLAGAARALLVGKKSAPDSRAAKLITPEDEKRLKAIIQSVPKVTADQRKVRAEGVARTTQLEILNNGIELFYDDFAATAGIVLEVALHPSVSDERLRKAATPDKEKSAQLDSS